MKRQTKSANPCDAAEPATVDVSQAETAFDIPAGTPVTIAPDGSVSFTAADPIAVTGRAAKFTATGPRASPPPAAPSPSNDTDATERLWAWIAAGLVGVGFVLGLLKGWTLVRIGGARLAGAAVVVIALQAVPPLTVGSHRSRRTTCCHGASNLAIRGKTADFLKGDYSFGVIIGVSARWDLAGLIGTKWG